CGRPNPHSRASKLVQLVKGPVTVLVACVDIASLSMSMSDHARPCASCLSCQRGLREALSSGYPRISGSKGAILLHRRNNCYAPIGTGNGGEHTARFGLARGRSLRRRDSSLALPMPARI